MRTRLRKLVSGCSVALALGVAAGGVQAQSLKPPVDLEKTHFFGKTKQAVEGLIGKPDQVREEKEGRKTYEAWIYTRQGQFVFGKQPVKRYKIRFEGDIAKNAAFDH
jgi:hypothetical protein